MRVSLISIKRTQVKRADRTAEMCCVVFVNVKDQVWS